MTKPHAPSLIQKIGIVPVNAREAALAGEAFDAVAGNDLARMAGHIEKVNNATPAHYDKPVQPWDLIEHMDSSGDVLIDHLRATVIEHLFRIKEDMLEDLTKAQSEITKAIARLKKKEAQG